MHFVVLEPTRKDVYALYIDIYIYIYIYICMLIPVFYLLLVFIYLFIYIKTFDWASDEALALGRTTEVAGVLLFMQSIGTGTTTLLWWTQKGNCNEALHCPAPKSIAEHQLTASRTLRRRVPTCTSVHAANI